MSYYKLWYLSYIDTLNCSRRATNKLVLCITCSVASAQLVWVQLKQHYCNLSDLSLSPILHLRVGGCLAFPSVCPFPWGHFGVCVTGVTPSLYSPTRCIAASVKTARRQSIQMSNWRALCASLDFTMFFPSFISSFSL